MADLCVQHGCRHVRRLHAVSALGHWPVSTTASLGSGRAARSASLARWSLTQRGRRAAVMGFRGYLSPRMGVGEKTDVPRGWWSGGATGRWKADDVA